MKKNVSKNMTVYLMCLPALLAMFMFLIIPFMLSIYYSFTNQRLISKGSVGTKFVGFENYMKIFSTSDFFDALLNTVMFVIAVVIIQNVIALLLAVLVNKKLKGITFFRTVYFSPIVLTMVVVSVVWALLFNPSDGFINSILSTLSFGRIQDIGWLYDTRYALLAIIILSSWQATGFNMIIILAGLQGISNDIYEAASIDGAGKIKMFFTMTIPMLKNTIIFVVISTTIQAFKLFTQVEVLTQGGPENATLTLVVLIFREGFSKMRVGYSSAISVLFFLIVLTISLVQRKILDREVVER